MDWRYGSVGCGGVAPLGRPSAPTQPRSGERQVAMRLERRLGLSATGVLSIALLLPVHAAATNRAARTLTFEERVRAQEAIERVYYQHQIGATRPFEEAVPRAALEAKVRDALLRSAALEK